MKTTPLFILTAALTGHCLALTPVKDSFSGTVLRAGRWNQFNSGHGLFGISNAKLEFTVTNPESINSAYLDLISSFPGYNENWQMTVDLANLSPKSNQVGCGFWIYNNGDRSDSLYVEFFGKGGIAGGIYKNGQPVRNGVFGQGSNVSKGAIRVQFNKTEKQFTFLASPTTKSQGYHFVKVGTFSPANGKGDLKTDWGMTNQNGAFSIQLFGYSRGAKVDPAKVTLDNFDLIGTLTAP